MKRLLLKIKQSKISAINIVALVLLCFFILVCLISFFHLNKKDLINMNNHNSTLSKITSFQKTYNKEKESSNKTPPTTNNILFDNGKDAVVSGINNLEKLDSYTVNVYGQITATCGLNLNIQMHVIQHKTNNTYEQVIYFYCPQNSTINSALYGSYNGSNVVQEKYTTNIWMSGSKFNSDIDSCSPYDISVEQYLKTKGIVPGSLVFDINNKTIKNTSDFYVSKDLEGNINYYCTNFCLNPNLSTTKYVKFIKDRLHGGQDFNFNNITGNAELNKDGNLNQITINDNYNLKYAIGPLEVPINVTSNFKFIFTY